MHNIIFYIWYKLPKFILIFLLPLSGIYFIVITIRKYFLINIFPRYKSQSILLIIGNLNVGGSGKTPFTIWLANYFKNKEKKIAIISSGYGSNVNSPEKINNNSKPEMVGDESILLYEKTLSTVVSSSNRVQSTKYLEDNNGETTMRNSGLTLEVYDLSWRYPVL